MKKQSYWLLVIIAMLGIAIILAFMYFYPYLIDNMMCHYLERRKFNNEPADRGTFGDMYGALNSFLSGLAVLGIVLTLYWEKRIQEDKEEQIARDKLIYLLNALKITIGTTKSFQNQLIANCDSILTDPSQVPALKDDARRYIIKTITEINKHEEYFLAYRRIFQKSNVIEALSTCVYIDEIITKYIELYNEYYTSYTDEHEQYLTKSMNILSELKNIAKIDRNVNQIAELEVIQLKLENSMLIESPLYISKHILPDLYNYYHNHYKESQFDEIKSKIEGLSKVNKSYEGIVEVFKRESDKLASPLKTLQIFITELSRLENG